MSKKKAIRDSFKVKGIFRLNLIDYDEQGRERVVGDSGWVPNQITNDGYSRFLMAFGAVANSSQVTVFALGTGTAPASNATALPGELQVVAGNRFSATSTSVVNTKTYQTTGQLASGVITGTTTYAIQNVGLFATSAVTAGTVMAGNTYATSSLSSNQAVNVTYQIGFT